MRVDPYWNHVSCLLHMDTQPAPDSKGKTVTQPGSPDILLDNFQTLFGLDTLFFAETSSRPGVDGSCLHMANSGDFNFGSGPFTIEGWFFMDTGTPMGSAVDSPFRIVTLIERANASFTTGCWVLFEAVYQRTGGSRVPELQFWLRDYSASVPLLKWAPAAGTGIEGEWRHIAIVRSGDTWRMYVQGTIVAEAEISVTITEPAADLRIGNSILSTDSIGIDQWPTGGRAYKGNIAQVRITKGFARYTVAFEDAIIDSVGPGAPLPDALDTGDYSDPVFAGPAGAAASGPALAGPRGEDGASGQRAIVLSLPAPSLQYDPANEAQTRRAIHQALVRGS